VDWFTGEMKDLAGDVTGVNEIRKMHDAFLEEYRQHMEQALCFEEAEMFLVGADTQSKRIERAQLDLIHALVQMRNAQEQLEHLISEGRRRYLSESKRIHTSLFHDTWEDLWGMAQEEYGQALRDHKRYMRLAQRLVYLAVRAVEYEFQHYSDETRKSVLRATDPADLEDVLDDLRSVIDTNLVNGQRPETLHEEFSLKQHLLQLASHREWTGGFHVLSETERLRLVLSSPRYAYYDRDGTYRGQLIPFSVMPLGVIGLGEPGTIALLTGSDCAERIWSVNATLHGLDLMDDDSTNIRMDLFHRNTFFSQWCVEPGEDQPDMQNTSVRPARNLLRDPVWGALSSDPGVSVRDQSDYAKTRIQSYFNVASEVFQEDDYDDGASEELAGRGLYGEYALFFPAEQLAMEGSDGLHLERVEDILIRFDYVSVAKNW
jgi:hypothetical protein